MLLAGGATITQRFCDVLARRGVHIELRSMLEVVEGGKVGTRIHMNHECLTIGRAPDCNIRPQDPFISLRHCRLKKFAGGIILSDLMSTNGTRVNGQTVVDPVELSDQDQIQVGRFVFAIDIYADVVVESDEDQRAVEESVIGHTTEEPTLQPTLFARGNAAGQPLPVG